MTSQILVAGLIPLHILHHAVDEEVFGQALRAELERHGYHIGPGTLYPMLHRLEARGLLRSREARHGGHRRRLYRATTAGRAALEAARPQVTELFTELAGKARRPRGASRRQVNKA